MDKAINPPSAAKEKLYTKLNRRLDTAKSGFVRLIAPFQTAGGILKEASLINTDNDTFARFKTEYIPKIKTTYFFLTNNNLAARTTGKARKTVKRNLLYNFVVGINSRVIIALKTTEKYRFYRKGN